MSEPKTTRELKVEIAALKGENVRLRKARAEDRQFAEDRVELAVALAKDVDTADLEHQIVQLQKLLAEEDSVIDRVCIYIMKRNTEE